MFSPMRKSVVTLTLASVIGGGIGVTKGDKPAVEQKVEEAVPPELRQSWDPRRGRQPTAEAESTPPEKATIAINNKEEGLDDDLDAAIEAAEPEPVLNPKQLDDDLDAAIEAEEPVAEPKPAALDDDLDAAIDAAEPVAEPEPAVLDDDLDAAIDAAEKPVAEPEPAALDEDDEDDEAL